MCSNLHRVEYDRWAASGTWLCPRCEPAPARPAPPVPPTPHPASTGQASFSSRYGLRIMQWNADGVANALPGLIQLVRERSVDVCVVQESKLGPRDKDPIIPGYATCRKDRPARVGVSARGGGLVTFIKLDIPFSETSAFREGSFPGSLEALAVRVRVSHHDWLTVVNVYNPPVGQDRGPFSSLISSPWHFFGGDWNAHSPVWDPSRPEDAAGVELEDWMSDHDLGCLNDGTLTRINRATGGWSAPDVTVAHSNWLDRADWSCLQPLSSDHMPILCDLHIRFQAMEDEAPQLKWDWRSADWEGYRQSVEAKVTGFRHDGESSLSHMVTDLTDAMWEAARTHVGMVLKPSHAIPWMTPEIAAACRLRNDLGRNLGANRQDWVNACRNVRTLIQEVRARRWRDFVESLGDKPDSPRAWGVLRSLSGKAPARAERNKAILHDGKTYVTDKSKANLFVRKYAQVSRHRFTREEKARIRRLRVRMTRMRRAPGAIPQECVDFSLSELEGVIREIHVRGAEGPDGIPPRFLQELGPAARSFMLRCFNQSWSLGCCPQSWRNAVIIPILKKDKPAGVVDSYRPFSLTSCLGKLMERLVANRLYHLAESRGLLTEDQAGFRRQRSTEDQILRVTQAISDGFQARPALRSVLALLDFSKAYDTVWRTDLLETLLDRGIPLTYVEWIRGFLTNRQGRVSVNGTLSDPRLFREGLPQGSVLSPLLFLFVINDLRPRIRSSITSMFADDVGLVAQSRYLGEAAAMLEADVIEVHRWSMEKKLNLNISKCEVSFFSPDPRETGPEVLPQIRVGGLALKYNPTPVFLGVTYDRTLSFAPQAKKVADRITTTSRLQQAVSGTDWGWDTSSQGRVYQSLGLSVARYCGAGWQPWLKPSNVEVIERAQSKCLRASTGMYRTSPVESLRREMGFSSMSTVIRRDAAVAMEKSLRLGPLNPRRQIATRQVGHRTNRGSWRELATTVVRAVGLGDEPRDPLPPASVATWSLGAPSWSISLDLLGGIQRHLGPDSLRVNALATICSYGPLDWTIFTDGSVEGGMVNGGCAAVICRGTMSSLQVEDVVGRRGARFSSSFDAEVSAMRVAVEWLIRRGVPGRSLICSDSRAVLEALRPGYRGTSGNLAVLKDRLRHVPGALFLQWVPAHCGLVGNELADQAAKAARSAPGPREPVSCSSAKACIRRGVADGPPPTIEPVRCMARGVLPSLASPGSAPARCRLLSLDCAAGMRCV